MDGIADYRFLRQLGEGAHGAFYLAVPPARLKVGAEYVAVKVLSGASDEDNLRRATRELRAFAAATSPHLVQLLDAGRQGDSFFYAMEYCEFGSLASPREPMHHDQVVQASAQAARGAHALHGVGLVHRSIKPANVLLYPSGARLADLGLVQALHPTQTLTGFGPVGAVEYIDPALLSGEPASPASDIWSLGVTLHRALTGEGIYGELPLSDPLLSVRRVLTQVPELSPRLEGPVAAVVARCLAPATSERPESARELARELESLS